MKRSGPIALAMIAAAAALIAVVFTLRGTGTGAGNESRGAIMPPDRTLRMTPPADGWRYVSIGDSYTIGNELAEHERWPNILVQNLRKEGVRIELSANPAVSGYTVQDAIRNELPVVQREKPNFITVLIGANDAFRGNSIQTFTADLRELLDGIEAAVPAARVMLITIPNYVESPQGRRFGAGTRDLQRLNEYNNVIRAEAKARDFEIVELYTLSSGLASDPAMFIPDGLHPSALQTARWEELIRKHALDML